MKRDQRPLRILQVVGDMTPGGGVPDWLMQVLRRIDRTRFKMDFQASVVHGYDDEIRALGSRFISCPPYRRQLLSYTRNLRWVLTEFGPYDIVHTHTHDFNGYIQYVAQHMGVPIRCVHSHCDTSEARKKSFLLRRVYGTLMRSWINRYATVGLAASKQAAADLYGPNWSADPRWQVLSCGIDLAPFNNCDDSMSVRAELGIPLNALVIGYVGRFIESKNHAFLIEVVAELTKSEPRTHLLLVGDGPLRETIWRKVVQAGLLGRVTFAGFRPDVPRLMLRAMDVFVFPSQAEGLGLGLIEAQAAGLPCVSSSVIPKEADVVETQVRRLSLHEPASVWAAAILSVSKGYRTISRIEALRQVEGSQFNIQTSVRKLEDFYLHCYEQLSTH